MEASGAAAGRPILAAQGVRKQYGALVVLDGVDLAVADGQAVGIVGPNGAGKTTLLDVLAGSQRPSGGRVAFRDHDVTALGAAARCRLGIGRTHQVPRPFTDMTVYENVLVGATAGTGLRGEEARERALEVLRAAALLELANRRAATLGLLDRKRLEMARALATGPSVLLLDEIAGGLTEEETHELVESIQALRGAGLGIVWIEHVVHALVRVAERLVCMSAGTIIAAGEPDAVMSDPAVIEAYVGSGG
jgi:branched-chain amino acid transport system ATP-binding protein